MIKMEQCRLFVWGFFFCLCFLPATGFAFNRIPDNKCRIKFKFISKIIIHYSSTEWNTDKKFTLFLLYEFIDGVYSVFIFSYTYYTHSFVLTERKLMNSIFPNTIPSFDLSRFCHKLFEAHDYSLLFLMYH